MTRLEVVPSRRSFFPVRNIFDPFLEGMSRPYLYMREPVRWKPLTDISQNEKEYIVTMEIPGVDRDAIDIAYSNGVLRVKGEKPRGIGESESDYCTETYSGSFERSLCIPGEIKPDRIDAHYKDGVLKVTLAKMETGEFKKIKIH